MKFSLMRAAAWILLPILIASMAGCAPVETDAGEAPQTSLADGKSAVSAADESASAENPAAPSGGAEAADASPAGDGASLAGDVLFSSAAGLYAREFDLTLTTSVAGGVIRYTLDGSDPSAESQRFTDALHIADRTAEANNLSAITTGGGMGGNGGMGGMGGNGGRGGNRGGRGMGGGSSAPTENVFKGTVVKAAVFSEDGEPLSRVFTRSYFVSEDILTRYELPIVSITTDAGNLFDAETGIYANYTQTGSEWERPVSFELFEADGAEVISQNMGVRVNGGTTRSMAQKALRFYANAEYDAEHSAIEYEIFDGLTTADGEDLITSFKRVILRSSGNDNSGTLFRDALMQSLVSDLSVDTQAARPCVAFINGEFWGIYNIRERYDDHYIAAHYGVDKDRVAMLELSRDANGAPEIDEGDESDVAFYEEMYGFFEAHSLAEEANYKKAQEYLDIDNFIDYYIANIYSGNQDWPGNNNIFWRCKTDTGGYDAAASGVMDGRFRWMMKDLDWGFGLQVQADSDTLAFALGEGASGGGQPGRGGMGFNSAWSTLFFRKLIENESFRAQFINRFCDVMNTNYDADTVAAAINAYAASIAGAMPEQIARYPNAIGSVSAWESNVQAMVRFAQQRAANMRGFLSSRFSLGDVVEVSLQANAEAGTLWMNDMQIAPGKKGVTDASAWSGAYFAGKTQTVTAVPLEGHRFVKFVVTDLESGEVQEVAADRASIEVGVGGTRVQAIFE